MKKESFPQHPLKDSSGRQTELYFSPWGQKMEHYDIEKPHRHQFYEILFFHKGGGIHDIDFNTHKAYSRSIHFVAPDNVHLLLRSKHSEGCSLMFSNRFLSAEELESTPFYKGKPVLKPDAETYSNIRNLLRSIENELHFAREDKREMLNCQMQLMLQIIKRQFKKEQPVSGGNDARPPLLQKFFKSLRTDFKSHLTVKQYAENLNITDKQLIQLCKQHTGKTPLKHIHESMVSEAKKLLFETTMSVKEIAYELQFEDPANFSRFFKSITGYTPQEYREGIQGKIDSKF